ncbi:uncharacterized protein LOC142775875 isoform X3 [Rhipicephalus microplus]|uniref:uncharacterized protein LOC142775875 isoform X3 n=1 Tax=Rhipicephalus microplus TaxID=6941 RepID=UPI003F6C8F84
MYLDFYYATARRWSSRPQLRGRRGGGDGGRPSSEARTKGFPFCTGLCLPCHVVTRCGALDGSWLVEDGSTLASARVTIKEGHHHFITVVVAGFNENFLIWSGRGDMDLNLSTENS